MLRDFRGLIFSLLLSVSAVSLWAAEPRATTLPPPLPEPAGVSVAPRSAWSAPQAIATAGLPGSARRGSPELAAHTTAGLPRATLIRVIDGDTIDADITFPWNLTLRDQSIRAADFDAWESSKRRRSINVTDAEVLRGKAATDYLAALVNGCDLIVIPADEPRDNYGRILARWYLLDSHGDLIPIARLMQSNGHTRRAAGNMEAAHGQEDAVETEKSQ